MTLIAVRNYQSSSIEGATKHYQRDAVTMAQHGYMPVSQSWQAPSSGNGIALVGILFIVAGWFFGFLLPSDTAFDPYTLRMVTVAGGFPATLKVGLLVGGTILGLVLVVLSLVFFRKSGVLTVTYHLSEQQGRTDAPGHAENTQQAGVHSMSRTTKTCPDCAESVLDAARICRHCRHEFWPEDASPSPTDTSGSSTGE